MSRRTVLLMVLLMAYIIVALAFQIHEAEEGTGLYGYVSVLQMRAFGTFDARVFFCFPMTLYLVPIYLLTRWDRRRFAAPALTRPVTKAESASQISRMVGMIMIGTGIILGAIGLVTHWIESSQAARDSTTPLTRISLADLLAPSEATFSGRYVQLRGAAEVPGAGWSYVDKAMVTGHRRLVGYSPLAPSGAGAGVLPRKGLEVWTVQSVDLDTATAIPPVPFARDGTIEGRLTRQPLPMVARDALAHQGVLVAEPTYLLVPEDLGGLPSTVPDRPYEAAAFFLAVLAVSFIAMGLTAYFQLLLRVGKTPQCSN